MCQRLVLLKGERVVEQRESKLRYNKKEMRCFRHFISFLLAVSLARLITTFSSNLFSCDIHTGTNSI